MARRWRVIAAAAVCVAAFSYAGCGSGSDGSTQMATTASTKAVVQLAKDEAQIKYLEKRIDRLQGKLDRLHGKQDSQKKADSGTTGGGTTTVTTQSTAEPPPGTSSFHSPSGNVSCQIEGGGATCTVASISTSFVMPPGGGAAQIQSGSIVPEGSGTEAAWGTTVSLGDVTCEIPLESEPRGITCHNDSTGHGFEASSVSERQRGY